MRTARAWAVLLAAVSPGLSACSGGSGGLDGGDGGDQPPAELCAALEGSSGLALCASFSALVEDADEVPAEIGGVSIQLSGGVGVAEGRLGPALLFDGLDDSALVPGLRLPGPDLTVEAWVRPEADQAAYATAVDAWGAGLGFWLGGTSPAGGFCFWSGASELADEDALVPGEWQHLAGVLDGAAGVAILYLNGLEVRRRHDLPPYAVAEVPGLGIGARGDRSQPFAGAVDEVMLWTVVRTPAEICADAGGTYSDTGCAYPAPVGPVPDPCGGVDCSWAGTCVLHGERPTCECDPGYTAAGLSCLGDDGPCSGIAAEAASWAAWYRGQIPADMRTALAAAVAEHPATSPAWAPGAEAWTALGQTALMANSLEPFCLGFLEAAAADPRNPVALQNAATCMFVLDWPEDAHDFLACSRSLAPQNASAEAALGYYESAIQGDLAAALAHYEAAADLDPENPEWAYQAMRAALERGDRETADEYLGRLPAASPGGSAGWRGASSSDGDEQGAYCCPCSGSTFETLGDCIGDCSATLSCFAGICAYSAVCEGGTSALSLGIKLCYPPSGLQVCLTFDTNGNIGIQVGASAFNGLLGVGAGFTYGTIDGAVNFVVDVGTSGLPINAGSSWTVNLATGQVQGSVGLGNASGTTAAQATLVTW